MWNNTVNDAIELGDQVASDEADNPLPVLERSAEFVNLRDEGFSPKEAIEAFLGIRLDKPRVKKLHDEFSRELRTRFCLNAIFVCLVTGILAPLIPWLLSQFGNKYPLVVSKWTPGCGISLLGISANAIYRGEVARQAERLYHECRSFGGCSNDIFERTFPDAAVSNADCPFTGEVCIDGQLGVRVERHLLPQDIGYNSASELSFHRALSCLPLNTDPFIRPPKDGEGESCSGRLFFQDDRIANINIIMDYTAQLCASNGPNKFSSNFSGWDGVYNDKRHARSMYVYFISVSLSEMRSGLRYISPHLYRADGTAFVALFYAGQITLLP